MPESAQPHLYVERLRSPVGALVLVAEETQLRSIEWGEPSEFALEALRRRFGYGSVRERVNHLGIADRLRRYFDGELAAIDEIPVAMEGTPFELGVWDSLRRIPVGTVTTYGALAVALGHPVSASRAVGLANGANPIPIVVPCHRVIGANGNLVGYGGGMHRKRWLLHHEGVLLVGS